jgi:hypothetical protein
VAINGTGVFFNCLCVDILIVDPAMCFRMQAEIALGTSMSYSQRTLMAARDQAVLLDQLQKGYQKRDDALVDMAQVHYVVVFS